MATDKPKITEIRDGVFHIHDAMGVFCTLVRGTRAALLIDTGYGMGSLRATAKTLTSFEPIVVNTHGHIDHIQANKAFGEVYLHPADLRLAKEHSSLKMRLVLAFSGRKDLSADEKKETRFLLSRPRHRYLPLVAGQRFDLGGTEIEVLACPGHTAGSVCFLDHGNRLLYGGDSLSLHVWMFLKESCRMPVYRSSLEAICARSAEFDAIVASHSSRPLSPKLVENLARCAATIDVAMSTDYNAGCAGRGLLYAVGLEALSDKFGVASWGEVLQRQDEIRLDTILDAGFATIAYDPGKLS